MRQYEVRITTPFRKGLRDHAHKGRHNDMLVRCHNFKPTPYGLQTYEPVEEYNDIPMAGGFPINQLFFGDVDVISIDGNSLNSQVYGNFPGFWSNSIRRDFLDFGTWWMITGITRMVQTDPINGVIQIQPNPNSTLPCFKTGCVYKKGQIIGGNISPSNDWHGCGPNSIVWGKIGKRE